MSSLKNIHKHPHTIRTVSIVIAILVVGLLIFAGPVSAVSLGLGVDQSSYKLAEVVTFNASVDINYVGERVPVRNVTLRLVGNTNKTCVFQPDGTVISGCGNLSISAANPSQWGYGATLWGYADTVNTTFGNGYGYGYAAGYELSYNVTWNLTAEGANTGNYTTNLTATANKSSGTSVSYYSSDATFIVDRTRPTVSTVAPLSGAAGIGRSVTIRAIFSETMNGSSISNTTFNLTNSAGTAVAGAVTSTDNVTFTYTPASSLSYATSYTATVAAAVTDVYGNALNTAETWTFTTESAPGGAQATPSGGIPGTVEAPAPITFTPVEEEEVAEEEAVEEEVQPGDEIEVAEVSVVQGNVMSFTLEITPEVAEVIAEETGEEVEAGGESTHTMAVTAVYAGSVTLTFTSDPVVVNVKVGETKFVNIDEDSANDLSVTLNGVKKGVADLKIAKLAKAATIARAKEEAAEAEEEETPVVEKEEPTKEKAKELIPLEATWIYVLIVVVILLLVGLGYWFTTKQE